MTKPIHVVGFAGSLRKTSFNVGLLRAAQAVLPEEMTLEIFSLAGIPLYNEDEFQSQGAPETVIQFKARIAAADALLIATPEYNYSISGVLKNALDWASRPPQNSPFNGKPLAIMGAGGGLGTGRAQYHLRQVAVFLNMFPVNKPEVLVSMASQKFDAEGNLTDEPTRKAISDLLISLASWTRRLRGEKK